MKKYNQENIPKVHIIDTSTTNMENKRSTLSIIVKKSQQEPHTTKGADIYARHYSLNKQKQWKEEKLRGDVFSFTWKEHDEVEREGRSKKWREMSTFLFNNNRLGRKKHNWIRSLSLPSFSASSKHANSSPQPPLFPPHPTLRWYQSCPIVSLIVTFNASAKTLDNDGGFEHIINMLYHVLWRRIWMCRVMVNWGLGRYMKWSMWGRMRLH